MRNLTHVVNVTAFVLLVGFALLTAQTTYGDTFRLPTGGTITGKLVATSGPTKCYKTTNGGITCGSQQNSFAVALAYARGKQNSIRDTFSYHLDSKSTSYRAADRFMIFTVYHDLMTTLSFYGGVNEIGGNKILLEDKDTRVFLDYGKGFSRRAKFFEEYINPRVANGIEDFLTMGLLPDIKGLGTY